MLRKRWEKRGKIQSHCFRTPQIPPKGRKFSQWRRISLAAKIFAMAIKFAGEKFRQNIPTYRYIFMQEYFGEISRHGEFSRHGENFFAMANFFALWGGFRGPENSDFGFSPLFPSLPATTGSFTFICFARHSLALELCLGIVWWPQLSFFYASKFAPICVSSQNRGGVRTPKTRIQSPELI